MKTEDFSDVSVVKSTSRILLNNLGALSKYGVIFSIPTKIVPI